MAHHPHVNESETSGLLPALGAETKFRTTFGTAWGVLIGLIGAAIWGTVVYIDVQTLKVHDAENTLKIEQISKDVSRLRWIMDPTASRAILSQSSASPQNTP